MRLVEFPMSRSGPSHLFLTILENGCCLRHRPTLAFNLVRTFSPENLKGSQ